MNNSLLIYLVFSGVVILALVFDLGLLSKKNTVVTLKKAIVQTIFWVTLAFAFSAFIWYKNGSNDAIQYLSAYLLEWSLSVDNIFVFIIIFSFFGVQKQDYSRVLLLGILMAVVFRILFIALGSGLVARFDWIMYIFGIFLVYTGSKMFSSSDEAEFKPEDTKLSLVVVMLGLIDIVFAVDSIPAVFSIIPDPNKKLLIYSSNIFAVLGLRSLFFLLRGAASKFDYLQQGIAIVLVFIGIKMLVVKWIHLPVWVSLLMIVICISGSIFYSIYNNRKGVPADVKD